ncbi:unnamed protein product [Phaedon cochleariae]|uniref:Uncharacterized protein n=1 Tax=Phaedon cochleariae TaxID=80249 RepID=A0A9N9X0D4_PHACE|nr:unnamed protein product [Phaedon cochleariae]
MNRSWNSSNSPGFVYFNQTPTKNPADTTEFLSFGDNSTPSPKLNHRFSPSNYGSPQFHSSPRKFNLRNTYRHSGGNQGNRSFNNRNSSNNSYSPNNSFNNSNNRNSRGNHKYRNVNYNNSKSISEDGKSDISHYYDYTCTLDPWADLQKELDKRREEEEAKQLSLAEDKQQDNSASSSSEESDSEESEESPAISSMAEDETT